MTSSVTPGTFDYFITDSLNRSTETEERAANKNLEFMYSLRRRMVLTQSQTQAQARRAKPHTDDDDGTYTIHMHARQRTHTHTQSPYVHQNHMWCVAVPMSVGNLCAPSSRLLDWFVRVCECGNTYSIPYTLATKTSWRMNRSESCVGIFVKQKRKIVRLRWTVLSAAMPSECIVASQTMFFRPLIHAIRPRFESEFVNMNLFKFYV